MLKEADIHLVFTPHPLNVRFPPPRQCPYRRISRLEMPQCTLKARPAAHVVHPSIPRTHVVCVHTDHTEKHFGCSSSTETPLAP